MTVRSVAFNFFVRGLRNINFHFSYAHKPLKENFKYAGCSKNIVFHHAKNLRKKKQKKFEFFSVRRFFERENKIC